LVINLAFSIFVFKRNLQYKEENRKILSQKKSSEVILGQISEQLAPFTEHFKYDAHKVKFLGQPIDYIYFGEDKIVILEVKSGNAKLTPKQMQIKNLIKEKKVFWEEFRIPDKIKPQPTNEN
jgi:predicted Holliday junction resolvase-like endonuclease